MISRLLQHTKSLIFKVGEKVLLILQPRISGKDTKIQFGAGSNHFSGWINSDIPSAFTDFQVKPQAYLDITKEMPIAAESCLYLYNEHLIEHITQDQAQVFFKECLRILQPGGVLRIATPDLEHLVAKYGSKQWRKQDWLTWKEYQFIQTPAQMLNIVMRWWGHQFVYDATELTRQLKLAGFKQVERKKWGKSRYAELKNRETRPDSLLILEAKKD